MPQIQDIYVKKIAYNNCLLRPVDLPKLSCLLFLPWYIAITGYHTSSDNTNSQKQLMARYRQMSKSLPGTSQPRKVKTTKKEYMCNNSSMLILCLLFYV